MTALIIGIILVVGGVAFAAAPFLKRDAAEHDGDPTDLGEMAERLVRDERRRVVSCATCGPRPEPGARYCSHCGRPLGGCPSCGREPRVAGARFCDHCGTALASP